MRKEELSTEQKALVAMQKGDYKKAIEIAEPLAHFGSDLAICILARIYCAYGFSWEPDYEKAFYWSKKAFDKGINEGEFMLARLYYNGDGVPIDYQSAYFYFAVLGKKGSPIALCRMGIMHDFGLVGQKSLKKAKYYYYKSKIAGHIMGKRNFGLALFREGRYLCGSFIIVSAVVQALACVFFSRDKRRIYTF